MAFINTIPASEAAGAVRDMYRQEEEDWGYVPSYATVFCYRPEVMERWGRLLAEIRRPVDQYRGELVTFVTALTLKHSPCSLAHGNQLAGMIGAENVVAIADEREAEVLSAADTAIVRFARTIARDASRVTAAQVDELRVVHGLGDDEIFDIAAIAASRSFFTKILDALGAEADKGFMSIDAELRNRLTVGRPISQRDPEATAKARA